MPEYLAPGVFIEETSFRSKSIEGVSTTTTGLIGPARYGPLDLENELITSVGEFERVYGNRRQLAFEDAGTLHNYLWHAVRAFFEEGGKRLYVSRVFRNRDGTPYTGFQKATPVGTGSPPYNDGHARALLNPAASPSTQTLLLHARYPGAAGNLRVRFTLRVSQNILSFDELNQPQVGALLDRDVVLIRDIRSPITSPLGAGAFYLAHWDEDTQSWSFVPASGSPRPLASIQKVDGFEIRVVTVTVTVAPTDEPSASLVWADLALDPAHTRDGAPDSLADQFGYDPQVPARNRAVPVIIEMQGLSTGLKVLQGFLDASLQSPVSSPPLDLALEDPNASDDDRSVEVPLKGGHDGARPVADDYAGQEVAGTTRKMGLVQFQDLEDISIVAAPGSTFGFESAGYGLQSATITHLLISHCERMQYRIAVLDSGNGQTLAQVRAMRAKLDSSYAALYYPWVRVLDPVTRQPDLPAAERLRGRHLRPQRHRTAPSTRRPPTRW